MVSPSPARRPGPSDRSPVNVCPQDGQRVLGAHAQLGNDHPGRLVHRRVRGPGPDPPRRPTHRHTTARRPPSRTGAVPPRPPQPAPGTAPSGGSSTPITWSAGVIGKAYTVAGPRTSSAATRKGGGALLLLGASRHDWTSSGWVRSFAIDRRSGSRPTPDRRRSPVFGVLWPPFEALVTAPRRGAARAGARRPRRGTCRSSGHRSGRGRCR